jgi:prepilin-type N-terminal cleavage/methylation domain-containing protein
MIDTMKKRRAFTLVEMLVVMAIIGIVAAMVVGMAKAAGSKRKQAQVDADKFKLLHLINNYQSKLNFYPADNANLVPNANNSHYDGLAATNPLIYELTGATNNYSPSGFTLIFDNTTIDPSVYSNFYYRSTVLNANPDEPHNFFHPGPQTNKDYGTYAGTTNMYGLLVPVDGMDSAGKLLVGNNYWHYDASTTNRHNPDSFDLWAEYLIDYKNGAPVMVTNGNW